MKVTNAALAALALTALGAHRLPVAWGQTAPAAKPGMAAGLDQALTEEEDGDGDGEEADDEGGGDAKAGEAPQGGAAMDAGGGETDATSAATATGEAAVPASKATRWGNGERVDVKGKGFSIVPPQGWEIHDDVPGTSLVFMRPRVPGMKYQATLQVSAFDGPKYIDKLTSVQFRDEIVARYSKMPSVTQYEMRDEAGLTFDDGAPGLLYYTDFLLGETHMMQMHVLASSKDHHFLLTYTDLADNFANREDGSPLSLAYTSIVSGHTETRLASRTDLAATAGAAVAALIVIGFAYRFWSMRRLRRFADEENAAVAAETTPADGTTGSAISGINAKLVFSKEPVSMEARPLGEEADEAWQLKDGGDAPTTAGDESWTNIEAKSHAAEAIDDEKERWENLSRKEKSLDWDDDQDVDDKPKGKVV